jgi:hypothetical protein
MGFAHGDARADNSRMLYDGYLETVATRFEAFFREISAEYNFDNGPEFEITLCKALRVTLPSRFGVCRGFVTTADGRTVGDDIIIFHRERFGTLRLLEQDTFAQKEKIPLETVCAYIEAKHTLCIAGDGGQSLNKAVAQVAAVKSLQRPAVPRSQITPQIAMGGDFGIAAPKGWPEMQNPLYGAVWARQVRLDERSQPVDDNRVILEALKRDLARVDVVIAGRSVIGLPFFRMSNGSYQFISPHFLPGASRMQYYVTNGLGFAIGVSLLLWALDNMQMLGMPWREIIAHGFPARNPH